MQLDIIGKLYRYALVLLLAILAGCGLGNSVNSGDPSDIHLQLGVRYLSMNKLELAKENLLLSLQNNSDNAQAHNAMAYLYEKLNEFELAKQQYQTALDLAPDDLGVQNNLGRFLCERGELEAGMAILVQVGSNPLNDKQWMALTNAGRCQLGLRQSQQAENYFKQALQLDSAYPPALAEMQKIAYQNGDFWAAKGYLQRYLGVAAHSAETLWLAAQTERAMGNKQLGREYKNLLLEKFPLSNEAKKIAGLKDF
jgi:type IV pilus assembly protein PilF